MRRVSKLVLLIATACLSCLLPLRANDEAVSSARISASVLAAGSAADDGAAAGDQPITVRIMSLNLWHGGDAGGMPIERSVAIIRAAGADIVGLQETEGLAPRGEDRPDRAAEIASILGWKLFNQGGRTAVISRFPVVRHTPRKWGCEIEVSPRCRVWMFNVHLAAAPYQPYQLLQIPYHEAPFLKTADEAIASAEETRGADIRSMLAEVAEVRKAEVRNQDKPSIFLTGDFNEPSHLDWTAAVAAAKTCPLEVAWPTSRHVESAGFVDAWREIHPDPVESPGYTWTPTTEPSDPEDHHDRIDFVYFTSERTEVTAAQVVGEKPETADIVSVPYPSDHRGVVATFRITPR